MIDSGVRTIGWPCPVNIMLRGLEPEFAITDWAAWIEGNEEIFGFGDSEEEAKNDLFFKICSIK